MDNKKNKLPIYIIGGALGLVAGLTAAYLLIKNQESNPDTKTNLLSKDGLKVGFNLAGLIKQIADLGKLH